eukprot:7061609-Prorocentrum_lima.AAC.1
MDLTQRSRGGRRCAQAIATTAGAIGIAALHPWRRASSTSCIEMSCQLWDIAASPGAGWAMGAAPALG